MHMRSFKFVVLTFFLSGCAVTPVDAPKDQLVRLSSMLRSLDSNIPKKESDVLSKEIFGETAHLVKAFDLTAPPLWHNTLVNLGLRKKGLCYHWSDALYLHLKKGKYAHFSFHLAGANIGEYFFEHNALVISKKAEGIENGIVIDPWRDSGKLFFSKVKEDTAYQWSHRTDRGCEP